jgi:hypothetical protein
VLPFDRERTPELEFETNFIWLPAARTACWISSHLDVPDKFSPAERPRDRRAYTHKLNIELDTSVSVFDWLRESHRLRGVELEGSLDYIATGLPRAGDPIDGFAFPRWRERVVVLDGLRPARRTVVTYARRVKTAGAT